LCVDIRRTIHINGTPPPNGASNKLTRNQIEIATECAAVDRIAKTYGIYQTIPKVACFIVLIKQDKIVMQASNVIA